MTVADRSSRTSRAALAIVLIGASLAGIATAPASAAPPAKRPNVVLILSDDQGWGDVTSHGNERIATPTLDRIAAEGARFERFFVCPLCAPTRASLLTGRYHLRTGAKWVTHRQEVMRAEEVTLGEVFRAAGYATACIGKWHNGAQHPHHPNAQGFDEFFGFCGGHWNDYADPVLQHNGRRVETQGFVTDVLTDAAIRFVERHRADPFLLYVPYNAPHSPFQVPQADYDRCVRRGLSADLALIYALIENLDSNVSRLLARLDDLELTERTIVVFLTDNGPNGQRFNGGMRGAKGSSHEGGTRVPCFVRWPGRIDPGTRIAPLAAHIDLLPTLVSLCGLPAPRTLPLDGADLSPLLLGTVKSWPERTLFEVGAVRTPRYRLVGKELFDMVEDPGQKQDVSHRHPEIVRELQAQYDAWHASVSVGLKDMPPPIALGLAESPEVELPVADGTIGGPLKYNHGPGWANSWVRNWSDPQGMLAWDVDVTAPGTYGIGLHYTCGAEDVGAEFQAEIAGRRTTGTLAAAFDPPLVRTAPGYAGEGNPDKPFAVLDLGRVELPRGRTRLTVRATKIPGRTACESQGVRIVRIE